MNRDAEQVKTRPYKFGDHLASANFRQGFAEVMAGEPFDYAMSDRPKTSDDDDPWLYERGRLFGLCEKLRGSRLRQVPGVRVAGKFFADDAVVDRFKGDWLDRSIR